MAYKVKVELHGGRVVDKYTTAPPKKGAGLAERFRYNMFVHLPHYKACARVKLGTDYHMEHMLYNTNRHVFQHGMFGNLMDYVPYIAPKLSDDPGKRFTSWLATVVLLYIAMKLGLWDTSELANGYGEGFVMQNPGDDGITWYDDPNMGFSYDLAHVKSPIVRALAKAMFGND